MCEVGTDPDVAAVEVWHCFGVYRLLGFRGSGSRGLGFIGFWGFRVSGLRFRISGLAVCSLGFRVWAYVRQGCRDLEGCSRLECFGASSRPLWFWSFFSPPLCSGVQGFVRYRGSGCK